MIVRISFAVTTHFDSLFDLNERSISKLKELLENETVEINQNTHPALQKLLIGSCNVESFDYVLKNEDIEIMEAERVPKYPMNNKSKPL